MRWILGILAAVCCLFLIGFAINPALTAITARSDFMVVVGFAGLIAGIICVVYILTLVYRKVTNKVVEIVDEIEEVSEDGQ